MSPPEIPTMTEFDSNLTKANPMNIWFSPYLILNSSKVT
uniref:Uncharacterized protein n=1 Tax=Nelumbo nucifera TaxID=4432 RepID=A0A822Y3K6_NELNU|nr:TPA_asm: hypothetical protein HUJ06_025671 [Nelumbo nucifera]